MIMYPRMQYPSAFIRVSLETPECHIVLWDFFEYNLHSLTACIWLEIHVIWVHSYGLTKSDVRSFRALPHSASIRNQLQGVEISESFLDKTRLKSW